MNSDFFLTTVFDRVRPRSGRRFSRTGPLPLTRLVPRWVAAATLVTAVLLGNTAAAQVRQAIFEVHDRGEVWETVKDDGTVGAPNPTDRFAFHPSMDWPGGPPLLLTKDEQRSYHAGGGMWIGGRRPAGSVFFTENGPFSFVDQGTFDAIVKSRNYAGTPGFDPGQAEETITASWTTSEGMRVTRVSRAWSYRLYRTFILFEYRVRNTGTAALSDVFVGFPYLLRPSYQDFLAHNGWGDDFNRTDDRAGYDSTLRMLYVYDHTPNFSLPGDVGNYYAAANELRTTGYIGVALVSADPASDARPQPATVLVAQLLNNERFLTRQSASPENLYAILSGADRSLQAPDTVLSPFTLMSCGPYTLGPGDSVRIILAAAVNGLPLDQAVRGLAVQGSLPAGLDSLRKSVSRATALAAAGFRAPEVPPPSPNIEILPLPTSKSMSLTWAPLEQAYQNPLTGRRNIRSYRIYRSDRSFNGPFSMIRRITVGSPIDQRQFFDGGLGRWRYIDQTISLGAGYFYAVTSEDSTGMESWLTNRNTVAVRASSAPAPDPLGVKVFPNPFRRVSGFPTAGEERSIVWTSLPALCTIRIYTSSGELVRTLRHESTASGEEVWDQLTDARQRTAPGIYFWTVESETGSARGTLLILK